MSCSQPRRNEQSISQHLLLLRGVVTPSDTAEKQVAVDVSLRSCLASTHTLTNVSLTEGDKATLVGQILRS